MITSIDFLKRERPLRLFRETLPAEGESIYPRRYDVLIVDEAHNCAPAGRGRYATDSLRTEAIRLLAPHFEHKLFLTATPHNGYPESFTALLELLDNQRFARGMRTDTKEFMRHRDVVMVRRLKSELPPDDLGRPRFPRRVIEPIEVDYPDEEKAVHEALRQYSRSRQKKAADHAEKFASDFVLLTLKKRLFSSPAAFATTLKQHNASLKSSTRRAGAAKPSVAILQRQIDRAEEEYSVDEQAQEATDDAVDTATLLFSPPTQEEQRLLHEMATWADGASARLDAKARELIRWLCATIRPNGVWTTERVIIFTEYRATQNWLFHKLAAEGLAAGGRLLTMYGGMDPQEREKVKAAFQTDPAKSPVRILLATDAASEGIDLQNHCRRLVHYEIPWNPTRLEQRNGRIDRHGQKSEEVLVCHFVGRGYRQPGLHLTETRLGDLECDLEFLMRTVRKIEAIREDIGKVGPVIAEQVEQAMLGLRSDIDTSQAERQAEPVRRLLKFERDLGQQIRQLMDQLDETRREWHLSPENVQRVVEIALDLAGQQTLIPAKVKGIWPDLKRESCPVFHLPLLTGSWQDCAEGLNHPYTGEPRPFVFDHNLAQGREDVVLVHLNHRLVQMSMRLLRAEVWSREGHKRLHRIAARVVPDSELRHPAVIAHARLVVTGGDCHRLHEEVITAGGLLRETRFSRFQTIREMQDAMAAGTIREPSEAVKSRLLELWPTYAEPLRQAIEARMKERTDGLRKALADRAEKEATDVQTILTELQDSIRAELNEPQYQQLELFTTPEREQLDRNMDALRARLNSIPEEIKRETGAIRARFADPTPRVFPVAVAYLVPERLAE